ncbi:MAG: DEAD/DEAH box helicase family protein [Bdellovibrionales bacterium]|nr:DEAD/DEAH box helicase family protein [Bdellovibrionales bacterium]
MNKNDSLLKVLNHIRSTSRSEKEKGSRFEKLMLSFFKTDSIYKNEFEEVWLWNQYPGRQGRDLGVDLVAKKYNGEKVAIQCKFYSTESTLTKTNIDSFLNELGKKEFSSGILVSTTDHWSDHAKEALKGRTKKCIRIGKNDLLDSSISNWWEFYKTAKVGQPAKKKLRPHQIKALKDVIQGFKKSDRGKLIMPCGTGKTFTALRIAEELSGNNSMTLILMPSLALVSQTYREFIQNTKKGLNAFIVCSDKKAGTDEEDISFADLPVLPTTDSKELAKNLKDYKNLNNKRNLIFSTYHSIGVIAKTQEVFDLIICDEAHRTTGVESKNKNEDEKSYWTQVHDNQFIKAKKRLYMTATSRIYAERIKKKADKRGYDIFSMDDKTQYGQLFYELKFSEAISLEK